MNIKVFSSVLVLSAIRLGAVDITGFGTGEIAPDFSDFSSSIQSAGTLTVTGADNGSYYGSFSQVSVGSPSALFLTATVTTNPNSNFQIELFDDVGNSRIYQANWSSFGTNTLTEVQLSYTGFGSGTFNGNAVQIGLIGSGAGLSSLSASLDLLSTVSAIPEPSTWAPLLGGAVLMMAAGRRRQRKVAVAA